MKNINKPILFLFFAVLIIICGCVSYEQSTAINKDGSAYMNIHYWTKNSNLTLDEKKIGKFDFTEKNIKYNYSSYNSEVINIRIEEMPEDSTTHVWLVLNVRDITKLSDAKGFENVTASWKESGAGKELVYTIAQDTVAAKNWDAEKTRISYKFEFPGEVISSNSAFAKGNTLTWDYNYTDLKDAIEMRALISVKD